MSWTESPPGIHTRHDGLIVQQDDSRSWFARWPGQPVTARRGFEGGWDERGWAVDKAGHRRGWGTPERAMRALDGEMPAADTQPPHPAEQQESEHGTKAQADGHDATHVSGSPATRRDATDAAMGGSGRAADEGLVGGGDSRGVADGQGARVLTDADPMWGAEDIDRNGPVGEMAARRQTAHPTAEADGPSTESAVAARKPVGAPPASDRKIVRFDIPVGAIARPCRSCGAPVYWIQPKDKLMPLNPDGTSHFATCPDADTWRKDRTQKAGPVPEAADPLPPADPRGVAPALLSGPEPPADMTLADVEDIESRLKSRGGFALWTMADGEEWTVKADGEVDVDARRVTTAHLRERLRLREQHNDRRGSAVISADGVYRYLLTRELDDNTGGPDWAGGTVVFVMLNPSTADADRDDATLRRCIGFARLWSYERLVVVNLYAYRSTDPAALKLVADPIGPDNDSHIRSALRRTRPFDKDVIVAWGANADPSRAAAVVALILAEGRKPYCFGITANGQPLHPLRLPADQAVIPYAPTDEAGGTPKTDPPATEGRTTGPAPDGPRAVQPVAAQPPDGASPVAVGGGAGPSFVSGTGTAATKPVHVTVNVTPRNPPGPAEAAPTGQPEPSALPPSPAPARQQAPAAAGVGGDMPDECQILTEDDHRARRVELPDGRVVQRMSSSLVSMALGLHPRGGPFAAWATATGKMAGPDDNERMRMGRRYEAPARDEYRFRHPEYRVQTVGTIQRDHWAADSADGIVLLQTGEPTATLEIKHRSRDDQWGIPGTDEVPPDVFVQALWHLWAHEVERCDVVLVVGLKLTEYTVRRHEPTLQRVVETAQEWWHRHVAGDVEPPLDATPLTALAVRAVYSQATEPPLEPTAAILELARRRAVYAAKIKEWEGYKELADTALRKAMGNHKGITGVVNRFPAKGKPDWKAILRDNPKLDLDAYRGAPEDRTLFTFKLPTAEPAKAEPKTAPAKRTAKGANP